MNMRKFVEDHGLVLMEAAIIERLRRDSRLDLHPALANTPLIHDEAGRRALERCYRDYIDIALNAELPFVMTTPTWRANRERVEASGLNNRINRDAAQFMGSLRSAYAGSEDRIKIGGMIG